MKEEMNIDVNEEGFISADHIFIKEEVVLPGKGPQGLETKKIIDTIIDLFFFFFGRVSRVTRN